MGGDSGSDSDDSDEDEDELLDDDGSLDSLDDTMTGEGLVGGGGSKRLKVPTNRSSITWILTRLRKEISDTNRGLFRAHELVRYAEKGPPKGPTTATAGMTSGGNTNANANASVSSSAKPDADKDQLPYDLPSAILVRDAFVHKMAALRKTQERLLLFAAGKSFNLDAVERLCNFYGYRLGNMSPDEAKLYLAEGKGGGVPGKGRRSSSLVAMKNNPATVISAAVGAG